MKFETTHASEKGSRRYQEDRHVVYWIPEEGYLLAVFDGHGGAECAEYCSKRLIALYHEVRNGLLVPNFETILRVMFRVLNKETQHMGSGCAASIAIIKADGSEVVVGVLGDAPVLVKQTDGGLWLAPEHNVRSNPAEVEAAKQRGGFVSGGYLFMTYSGGGLQMSRALGDVNLDKVLNREPDIFRLPIGAGDFVLVASDGLFDPSHATKPANQIAEAIKAGANAEHLAHDAVNTPTEDNVTAILVKLV
jgi:serine/threonine protein phosphatase PrpC